jgi:lipopolysaccharide/colanic/teichoic acid biosynthesis glycosyltransferase
MVYCNASNIGNLLVKINSELDTGDRIKLKIEMDKNLYYGYFIYYGFEILNLVENNKKSIVDITKKETINSISDKKYSWLIKLPRTGKNGKRIFVYKLRTMQPYSEYIQDFIVKKNGLNEDGTIRNDFRITKVGKILRKYWIDELPMLINFFKGDLKLIGFRPLSDTMLSAYPKEFVVERNKYKPGLIPPYYIDSPDTFEGLIESEKKYIKKYKVDRFRTDVKYFFMFLNKVLLKGVRSS